jgi:hypothetical protein
MTHRVVHFPEKVGVRRRLTLPLLWLRLLQALLSFPGREVGKVDRKLGSWEAGLVKTTLDLPDELVREVKLLAVVQGRTVKDLVAELLRQGLGMGPLAQSGKPSASSRVDINETGFPVIRCRPDAPATRMSTENLLKLEQESQATEDLKYAGISH